jgi:hypothetical protein
MSNCSNLPLYVKIPVFKLRQRLLAGWGDRLAASPPLDFKPRYIYKDSPFPSIHFFASSLLLRLFFFIEIGIAQTTTRPLYNDLQWRMQGSSLPLTVLSIFVLPWLTFTFCTIVAFFLKRSNGMAMDIGSLALGHNGHLIRLGIGLKGLRKTRGNPFRGTHFSIVDSVAIALPKSPINWLTSFEHCHWFLWHCWLALPSFILLIMTLG